MNHVCVGYCRMRSSADFEGRTGSVDLNLEEDRDELKLNIAQICDLLLVEERITSLFSRWADSV